MLVCPRCGGPHPDTERFCTRCSLPLVAAGGPAEAVLTDRQEQLRKIKKQYAEGELVRVAVGRQLPEAELIQNLLLEEGVPSTLRRTRGFDVPEMLAAGPRDVLVPQSGADAAREMLGQADLADLPPTGQPAGPGRILVYLLLAVLVVALASVAIDAITP
jgi:hypothetical protein